MARSKYNVDSNKNKRTYNDIVFDSELEMKYYRDVVLPLYEDGEIIEFELQKKYELQPSFKHENKTVRPITYVADFFLKYKDGREEVIDTKGMPDNVAKLKQKLMWYIYPDINLRWMAFSKIDGGWCDYDYIKKQRAIRKKNKQNKSK